MPFALLLLATAVLFHFSVEVGEGDSGWGSDVPPFVETRGGCWPASRTCLDHDGDGECPLWSGGSSVHCRGHGRSFLGFPLTGRSPVPSVSRAGDWLYSNSPTLWALRRCNPSLAVGNASFTGGHAMVSAAT